MGWTESQESNADPRTIAAAICASVIMPTTIFKDGRSFRSGTHSVLAKDFSSLEEPPGKAVLTPPFAAVDRWPVGARLLRAGLLWSLSFLCFLQPEFKAIQNLDQVALGTFLSSRPCNVGCVCFGRFPENVSRLVLIEWRIRIILGGEMLENLDSVLEPLLWREGVLRQGLHRTTPVRSNRAIVAVGLRPKQTLPTGMKAPEKRLGKWR
jgi:hypothetical protein